MKIAFAVKKTAKTTQAKSLPKTTTSPLRATVSPWQSRRMSKKKSESRLSQNRRFLLKPLRRLSLATLRTHLRREKMKVPSKMMIN